MAVWSLLLQGRVMVKQGKNVPTAPQGQGAHKDWVEFSVWCVGSGLEKVEPRPSRLRPTIAKNNIVLIIKIQLGLG